MVVGEYGRDQGFFLPNPVSIHPEYLRSRFEIAWCMLDSSKNEDTWYKILKHYNAKLYSTLKLLWNFLEVVAQMVFYINSRPQW